VLATREVNSPLPQALPADTSATELALGCVRRLFVDNRPWCICVHELNCPCRDLADLLRRRSQQLPLETPRVANSIAPRPVAFRLPIPTDVAEDLFGKLEKMSLPVTLERAKELAREAFPENFAQFEKFVDDIIALIDAVSEDEIPLKRFYEEMIRLEDQISLAVHLGPARDILLQEASIARHSVFHATVNAMDVLTQPVSPQRGEAAVNDVMCGLAGNALAAQLSSGPLGIVALSLVAAGVCTIATLL
jgi:hypothetical protein